MLWTLMPGPGDHFDFVLMHANSEVPVKPADQPVTNARRWGMLIDINKLTDGGVAMVEACKREHGWDNNPLASL